MQDVPDPGWPDRASSLRCGKRDQTEGSTTPSQLSKILTWMATPSTGVSGEFMTRMTDLRLARRGDCVRPICHHGAVMKPDGQHPVVTRLGGARLLQSYEAASVNRSVQGR